MHNQLTKHLGIKCIVFVLFSSLVCVSSGFCQWLPNGNDIFYSNGNVGIGGTPSANKKLEVFGSTRINGGDLGVVGDVYVRNPARNGTAIFAYNDSPGGHIVSYENSTYTQSALIVWDQSSGTFNPLLNVGYNGTIGIGTLSPSERLHVMGNAKIEGDVIATGNIAAKYQDIAEWVNSSKDILAGTVVIVNSKANNQVIPSIKAYDTRVAGVVSATPGMLLGEKAEGKVKVATTGRVKVKVDASKIKIEIGDLLVTSNIEGTAMKSEPLDFSGISVHRPGTLIGKALEPLDNGVGEILVLLTLQ